MRSSSGAGVVAGRRPGRSRSRPSPRGSRDQRALAAALEERARCRRRRRGRSRRRRRRERSSCARELREQQLEVLLVGRVRAGEAGRVHAGAPAERRGRDPRVVGDRRLAGRRVRGARLDQRVVGEGLARLRGQLDLRRAAGTSSTPVRISRELAQLVLVAGRDDEPRLRAHPGSGRRRPPPGPRAGARSPARRARAARRARRARRGVRSAVAWTSTRPPSPVMTTLASTSAVESSE